MNFLFKTKAKTPAELIKSLKESLTKPLDKKNLEEMSKTLSSIKNILYGDGESEPNAELVSTLAQEVYNTDLLGILLGNLDDFEFEVIYLLLLSGKKGCFTDL